MAGLGRPPVQYRIMAQLRKQIASAKSAGGTDADIANINRRVPDFGGAWRFTQPQQIDGYAGFGFNRRSPWSCLGLSHTRRLDSLV